MSYKKPDIFKTKTTLICLSSGQIEKVYLYKILKDNNELYYHNNGKDKELDQLVKRHKKDNSIDKVIDGICKNICDIIDLKLNDQLSFGNQNTDYLLVIITDCDKAPFYAFDNLKNSVKNIISNNENFNDIKYYFIFSYRGFEDWMQFYYDSGNELIKNIGKIKKKVKKDIKNGKDIIFNNHKKAVGNYYKMVKYSEPVSSYEEIEEIPYSDFPYFFKFLDENYDTEILI